MYFYAYGIHRIETRTENFPVTVFSCGPRKFLKEKSRLFGKTQAYPLIVAPHGRDVSFLY